MLQQSTQVRAACLRAVRHLLGSSEDIIVLNALQFPQLVARSLDVVLRNELERIQALKLIRKVLLLNPEQFDMALARSLVSLANGVTEEKERMLRACLAALCELAVLNADLFMRCGGVTAITRNILDCQMPRIVECLCGVLLHLLHTPATRMRAHVDLQCLAAPYCDFHYRHAWMDKSRDERELRFNCSRLALLSVLRSWPGLLHFCTRGGGLQAIVQVLYLNQLEVRKAVLDLLYELLGLPQPDWTDEYAVALNAVDPSDPQDCWRLGEGFIVAEARAIMPHLARCTPNIADIHLAVLLYVFLEVGLLGALVEVIVSSDTFISVRATVLLGELLHLMHVLLPPECCDVSPALPGLLARAPHHQGHHQALAAVTALNQLHALLKRRPASSSLFLDHILRAGRRLSCTGTGERIAGAQRSRRHRSPTIAEATDEWRPVAPVSTKTGAGARIYRLVRHGSASSSAQAMVSDSAQSISPPDMNPGGEVALLRESGVLQNKEGFHAWNWNVIGAILRRNGDLALRLDDSNHRLFLRRLVHYYQPSSNRYSHLDLPSPQDRQSHVYTAVGCELVRRLLAMSDQPESTKLLLEWFTDILNHIDAISTSKSAHDCLFSPQHMATTLCQTYFLFIGHVCHTLRGINLLKDIGLFTKLAALATTTNHSCYVKLIVSSFDYATDGPHRGILAKILTCRQESSRLYATQFLLVLLRAGLPSFERWGVEMLVKQLFDQSKAVSLAALNIAHEACERRSCLERLVELRPDLQHLGDKGLLLLARLMSLPRGFRVLGGSRFATAEIVRWADSFVYRYVSLLEAELLDALTLHQRSEDGRYDRRHSSAGRWAGARRDVFIPPHLFGQLAQHEQGWSALLDSGRLIPFITLVLEAARKRNIADWYNVTDKDILELKAAMWACGHVATSTHGTQKLIDDGFFKAVIDLAESCAVYSIRGTAVYVLGLMATTYRAANELFSLGWACVRHDRHDRWPVVEEEDWSTCTQPPPLAPRSDSEEDGGTTISSSDNVPAWAAETWVDEVDELGTPALRQPTIINELAVQHKRSLSESHRNRDNSCTESTTSGVSSSDSAAGPIPIKDKPQIQNNNTINNGVNCRLSPIPSSSSLSTLKTGLEMMRHWTADGPRRVSLSAHSCSNSTSLTVSPPDVNGSRLSHQDLLGYSTLRTLRRVRASSFRSDSFNRQLNRYVKTINVLFFNT